MVHIRVEVNRMPIASGNIVDFFADNLLERALGAWQDQCTRMVASTDSDASVGKKHDDNKAATPVLRIGPGSKPTRSSAASLHAVVRRLSFRSQPSAKIAGPCACSPPKYANIDCNKH